MYSFIAHKKYWLKGKKLMQILMPKKWFYTQLNENKLQVNLKYRRKIHKNCKNL